MFAHYNVATAYLAVAGNSGKDGGRVRRPGDIRNWALEVKRHDCCTQASEQQQHNGQAMRVCVSGQPWSRQRHQQARTIADPVVPQLDGPVSGATDKDVGMEGRPLDGVDSQKVSVVRHQVLARVGLGALVDLALLCANNEAG